MIEKTALLFTIDTLINCYSWNLDLSVPSQPDEAVNI